MAALESERQTFQDRKLFPSENPRHPIQYGFFSASTSPWRQQAAQEASDALGIFETPIPISISGPEDGGDAGKIALGKVRQAAAYALDHGLGMQKPGKAVVVFGGDSFNFYPTGDGTIFRMQKPRNHQDFEQHAVLWEQNLRHGLPIRAQKGYAVGLYAIGVPPIEFTSTGILQQQITDAHYLKGLFCRDNFDYASQFAGSMPGPEAIESGSLYVYDSSGRRLSKQEAIQAVMAAESRQAEQLIMQAYTVLKQYMGSENGSRCSTWIVPLDFNRTSNHSPSLFPLGEDSGTQPLLFTDIRWNIQELENQILALLKQGNESPADQQKLNHLRQTQIRMNIL